MKFQDLEKQFRVKPGSKVRLKNFNPAWCGTPAMEKLGKVKLKDQAAKLLAENLAQLAAAQELLYANDRYSVLIVIQAIDAAGKDGLIRHVMSGVNPQGCQVYSFKKPSEEELDHDFLWRCSKALPERGRIGIFNRSYYEEVLVAKVHPTIVENQKLPEGRRGRGFWQDRYDDINAFERHLVRNGTVIIKLFLILSKDEQKRRFLERIAQPEKHWKFAAGDIGERALWDDYQVAYEDAIEATSTKWAPWHILPADHKWVTRALASEIITETIDALDLKYPALTPEIAVAMQTSKASLLAEK